MFGIPVTLFAGAGGYYFFDYQGKLCPRDKVFKVGIIPGAWISVYAGASVSLFIVEAGITIEARLLETYLVPGKNIARRQQKFVKFFKFLIVHQSI